MDLEKYCCKDPERKFLSRPFTQHGITWATNGAFSVGIPSCGAPDTKDRPVDIDLVRNAAGEPGEWFGIPQGIEYRACPKCKGIALNFECYECHGHGHVTLENEFTRYSGIECGSCEGEGKVPICIPCGGTGIDNSEEVFIGGVMFLANALHTLKDLPNLEISPTGKQTPAHLRFDGGGVGFLMPGKEDGEAH